MFADKRYLTGQDDQFIDRATVSAGIHRQALAAFLALQHAAAESFELTIASGYRDFNRQLAIWNGKATGERPVLDKQGRVIDISTLDPWSLVQAILRWSALPGASRHHWGTDIDVYDKRAVKADYQLQLSLEEVSGSGPFVALHEWLDEQILRGASFGFFRPYQIDSGGIAPERWHLSYLPLAQQYQRELSLDYLRDTIAAQPIALKQVVLANLEEIYHRYIVVEEKLYPTKLVNTQKMKAYD